MRWLIDMLIEWLKEAYLDSLIRRLKAQVANIYLEAMKVTRRVVVAFGFMMFVVALIGAGFVLIPLALLLFMPWGPHTKAVVGIVTGVAYIVIPLVGMLVGLSEKRWLALTGARDALNKLRE